MRSRPSHQWDPPQGLNTFKEFQSINWPIFPHSSILSVLGTSLDRTAHTLQSTPLLKFYLKRKTSDTTSFIKSFLLASAPSRKGCPRLHLCGIVLALGSHIPSRLIGTSYTPLQNLVQGQQCRSNGSLLGAPHGCAQISLSLQITRSCIALILSPPPPAGPQSSRLIFSSSVKPHDQPRHQAVS